MLTSLITNPFPASVWKLIIVDPTDPFKNKLEAGMLQASSNVVGFLDLPLNVFINLLIHLFILFFLFHLFVFELFHIAKF